MKFGMRKPSLRKKFGAKKASIKRKAKKALVPGYGKKGRGILHPKKSIYNKVYNKTTFSFWDKLKRLFS